MDVRVFKILSGEMVIGQVVASAKEDSRLLSQRDNFVIESPVLLHFNGQGFGLAPLYPWADPKSAVSATFPGNAVMCEAEMSDPMHSTIVREYTNIVSRIQLATAAPAPMPAGGNLQFN